jgi:hypothetical protein
VNEELALIFREQLLEPRLDLVRAVFRRAVERGEVSPDLDYDAFAHMIIGANMFRTVIAGRAFSQTFAEAVLGTVLAAISAESHLERA